jgi:hypothetical protein
MEADEIVLYDFTKPGYSSATGHFTQIVWKGTTKIGCAAASCADGTIFSGYKANSTYVVCKSDHYPQRSRADEKASIRLLEISLAATRLELSSCSLPTSVSRFRSRLLASYDHMFVVVVALCLRSRLGVWQSCNRYILAFFESSSIAPGGPTPSRE